MRKMLVLSARRPKQDKEKKESVVITGRAAFITTLVAIILNPISVAVGYYMNHFLQRPELEIQYISDTYFVENHKLDPEILQVLKNEAELTTGLRDVMFRQGSNAPEPCTAWLDGEPWIDNCRPSVEQAVNFLIGAHRAEIAALRTNLAALEALKPDEAPNLRPMQSLRVEILSLKTLRDKNEALGMLRASLMVLESQLGLLQRLSSALQVISDNPETPRTGVVEFDIGVLNNGDADGVIFKNGALRFDGSELWMYSETFNVVKAHSFAEIKFRIGEIEQDSNAMEAWKELVTNKKPHDFEVVLNPKKGNVTSRATLNY
jgi:hypothetical protein